MSLRDFPQLGGIRRLGDGVIEASVLKPVEQANINWQQLDDLCRELGQQNAAKVISRALDRLAECLGRAAQCNRRGERDNVVRHTRAVRAVADQIGMGLLAAAAENARQSQVNGDVVAIAATMDRVARLGQQSIVEIWDFKVQSR